MGKKYIIEIGRLERLYKASADAYGKPSLTWLSPEVDLTPYTEPDLEQVRRESYQKGYDDAVEKIGSDEQAIADKAYKKGLSDAWEAAKKIQDTGGNLNWWIHHVSAPEAIEKIRQHEQEKEEQITKGDVIRIKSTPEIEILVTYADEEYVSGIALTEVDGNCEIGDQYTNIWISNVEKTGKHYDIVSVLQKIKEAFDG